MKVVAVFAHWPRFLENQVPTDQENAYSNNPKHFFENTALFTLDSQGIEPVFPRISGSYQSLQHYARRFSGIMTVIIC